MSASLQPHRHSTAGFELPVPEAWERSEDVEACALVAVEPPRDDPHLRASVVVTLEVVPDDEDLEAWTRRSLDALGKSFERHRLIDLTALEIDGRPAMRALSHYLHADHGGACLEQWLVQHGGLGVVVSCTTAALEYDDLFELMHAIAEGLRLP
jgi:hypothetical protein